MKGRWRACRNRSILPERIKPAIAVRVAFAIGPAIVAPAMGAAAGIFNILGPILLMIGLGALVRWRFHLDQTTLARINIYFFVPAFVFDKVVRSDLGWATMGGVVAVTVLQVTTIGMVVWGVGRALRMSRSTTSACAMATMFYNSGNYGLPLAELAYGQRGSAVQTFVLMSLNLLTFTLGVGVALAGGHGERRGMWGVAKAFLKLPFVYMLAAALAARWWIRLDPEHHALPAVLMKTSGYVAAGLVPIALATLGAQLVNRPRRPRWKPVSFVLVMRLLAGPIQMGLLLYGLHALASMAHGSGGMLEATTRALDLWPWPAELLILTAAVPTAVNTLLLTMELGGEADLAADCVFWTTVVSCATISVWLVAIPWGLRLMHG